MVAVVIASAGTPESALIRVGGDGTQVGTRLDEGVSVPVFEFTTAVFMEVDSQIGGRCIARFTRPNALSGPTELTVQLDAAPGEIARVRVSLSTLTASTDPASQNYLGVSLAWVSYERAIQDAVVAERIRRALQYTRNRLLDFPAAERQLVATWEIIADELAAQVSQKVVGGTIEAA
jgi:hypothetical protein